MVIILKLTSIGADISSNDVSCSNKLVSNIKQDIPQLLEIGAFKADLTNITGDDLVISAFVPDELFRNSECWYCRNIAKKCRKFR